MRRWLLALALVLGAWVPAHAESICVRQPEGEFDGTAIVTLYKFLPDGSTNYEPRAIVRARMLRPDGNMFSELRVSAYENERPGTSDYYYQVFAYHVNCRSGQDTEVVAFNLEPTHTTIYVEYLDKDGRQIPLVQAYTMNPRGLSGSSIIWSAADGLGAR